MIETVSSEEKCLKEAIGIDHRSGGSMQRLSKPGVVSFDACGIVGLTSVSVQETF